MKKTIKMIGMACLVGALAFVGSSCKKNNTNNTSSIKLGLPTLEETSVDGERVYIEYSDLGNSTLWSRNDQVMYYNLKDDYTKSVRQVYTLYDGAGTSVAHFSGLPLGDVEEGAPGYFAFYPAEKVMNDDNDQFDNGIGPRNSQTFTVDSIQNYNANTMDPTSCVLAINGFAPEESFTFAHIFGFVRLKLKGAADKAVESISITDKSFSLTGKITVDLPAVNSVKLNRLVNMMHDATYTYDEINAQLLPYLYTDEDGLHYNSEPTGKTVKLECGGVQLNPDNYTDFYITLRPGSLGNGFVVTVKYTDGTQEVFRRCDPEAQEWGFDPAQTGHYVPGTTIPMFPRYFTVLPGTVLGIRLN